MLIVIRHSAVALWETAESGEPGWLELLTGWTEIGVPMFFVISGYCISATADATRQRGTGSFTFFRKRFRRIFPPYWAAVITQVAVIYLVDAWLWPGLLSNSAKPILPPWWFDGWQWFGNLTLTESWRHHLVGTEQKYILGQSWTLCYEEQFYAVVGLSLLLTRRWLFSALAVVTVAVLIGYFVLPRVGLRANTSGFFFDGYWFMFSIGVLVYHTLTRPFLWKTVGAVVTASLLAAYGWKANNIGFLSAGLFSVGLIALRRWDHVISEAPLFRPLSFCGTICYSLYLTHAPIVRAISQAAVNLGYGGFWTSLTLVVPMCVVVAIVYGWLFFLLVEQHFLNTRVKAVPEVASPSQNAG